MKIKMSKKLWWLIAGIGAIGTAAITGSVVLTACGSESSNNSQNQQTAMAYDQKVSDLTKEYRNHLNGEITKTNGYYIYTDDLKPSLLEICNKYLLDAQNIYHNHQSELSVDGKIWLDSLIDEIETKIDLIKSNIHYLLPDSSDTLMFTNYRGTLASQINSAIRKSIVKDGNTINYQESTKNYSNFVSYLTMAIQNLKDGLANKVTMSGIMTKHSIGNLLQNVFGSWLTHIAEKNNVSIITNFEYLKTNNLLLFTNAAKTSLGTDNSEASKNLLDLALKADQKLVDFLKFVTNDYYSGIEYGGNTSKAYSLTISNANPAEEDNGFSYKKDNSTTYLTGLGLSDQDLGTKDIGIGFMKEVNGVNPGKAIYNALLRKHSNTTSTANQIFNLGNDAVANIKKNMEAVAKTVAEVYVGKNAAWSPKGEMYDADSSGNKSGAVNADSMLENIVDASGKVDLAKFFIWLNTNRWFNGRDMTAEQFPTIDGKTPIFSKYTQNNNTNPITKWDGKTPYQYETEYTPKNSGITKVNVSDVFGNYDDYLDASFQVNENLDKDLATKVNGDAGNLAYQYLVLGLSPATIQSSSTITNASQTNSISPEAAFIGTSKAIKQYLEYKDVSAQHFNSIFKNTSIDYTLRTGTGGAAYASSGKGSWSYDGSGWGGFYLDSNPYFGLQKWSMTTLATHEGVSGHVYQFNYAHDHPAQSIAPSFRSTAYAEGWGLFSEWLAVQIGMYGEPVAINTLKDNQLALPKFGTNSKNIDLKQYKNQYDYANGAYWVVDDKTTTEVDEGNSQVLFDAVQYFGFLNERQLRAMRCAVDVGLHAGATIDQNGVVSNPDQAGQFTVGSGWSLKEARAFLKANSGLGIDDINRETKRYLEYTGQAVSYYNGTVKIQDAYINASTKYYANFNKAYLNWSDPSQTNNNTADFFDLILRNGSIPLSALENATTNFIANNYNKS